MLRVFWRCPGRFTCGRWCDPLGLNTSMSLLPVSAPQTLQSNICSYLASTLAGFHQPYHTVGYLQTHRQISSSNQVKKVSSKGVTWLVLNTVFLGLTNCFYRLYLCIVLRALDLTRLQLSSSLLWYNAQVVRQTLVCPVSHQTGKALMETAILLFCGCVRKCHRLVFCSTAGQLLTGSITTTELTWETAERYWPWPKNVSLG